MASSGQIIMPYGPAIYEALASGDLDAMKKKANEAEKHLNEHGDIRGALAVLKAEIAKLEK